MKLVIEVIDHYIRRHEDCDDRLDPYSVYGHINTNSSSKDAGEYVRESLGQATEVARLTMLYQHIEKAVEEFYRNNQDLSVIINPASSSKEENSE